MIHVRSFDSIVPQSAHGSVYSPSSVVPMTEAGAGNSGWRGTGGERGAGKARHISRKAL